MNVSDLIKELEHFNDLYGDLTVCVLVDYDVAVYEGELFDGKVERVCIISYE